MSTHVPVHVHAPGRGGGVVVFAHVHKMCMFQVGGEGVDNFQMFHMCLVGGRGGAIFICSVCAL